MNMTTSQYNEIVHNGSHRSIIGTDVFEGDNCVDQFYKFMHNNERELAKLNDPDKPVCSPERPGIALHRIV